MLLSAIIIAKNEEDNIGRCINSLKFADEVIVIVDAGSQDATGSLARKLGARVFVQPWHGYGPQKNFGLKQARGAWVLFIDADEEVTPPLAQEIISTIKRPKHRFYWLRIATIFLEKPLHHLIGHNPRLFRRESGRWSNDYVHEQIETVSGDQIRLGDQHSGVLSNPLPHHSHRTVHSYLNRMHRYTTLDAEQMAAHMRHRSGKRISPSLLLPLKLSLKQFLKLFLYRRGVLDGYPGTMWSLLSAYYEWEMAKKFIKLKNQNSPHFAKASLLRQRLRKGTAQGKKRKTET